MSSKPKVVRVNLPKSGMGIEEGTVFRWHRSVGEHVLKGETLVEIETAKAMTEVLAPASGRLVVVSVAAGETTPVNTSLGMIEVDEL